jgi:hypothetical protein
MSTTKVFSQKWVTAALLIAILIILFGGYFLRRKWERDRAKKYVFVEVRAFQGPLGWGYDILQDKKVYIHQDIIPVLPGKQGFQTKEEALAVGRKVLERLQHQQLPDVTLKDLQEAGIDTNKSLNP